MVAIICARKRTLQSFDIFITSTRLPRTTAFRESSIPNRCSSSNLFSSLSPAYLIMGYDLFLRSINSLSMDGCVNEQRPSQLRVPSVLATALSPPIGLGDLVPVFITFHAFDRLGSSSSSIEKTSPGSSSIEDTVLL